MKKLLIAICLVTTLFISRSVFATDLTGSIAVGANVLSICTFTTTSYNLAFGDYNPSSNLDNDVSLKVTCTADASYTIVLSNGGNYLGGTRRMSHSTYYLNYGLYTNALRTTSWPDIGNAETGTGSEQSIPIYGRVPSAQGAGAGSGYSDSVAITITY